MKRWWVRLLLAYLIAGMVGTSLMILATLRSDEPAAFVFRNSSEFPWIVLLWPFLLAAVYVEHDPMVHVYEASVCYVGVGILGYLLLSRFAQRRVMPGHCQTCGYDLRATPERCPECGKSAMIKDGRTTEATEDTESTEKNS